MRLFFGKNQVANEFIWMYLIIFLIPLARILPRIVRKYRSKNPAGSQPYLEKSSNQKGTYSVQDNPREGQIQTKDMRVIDELNRRTTKFGKIQKNTGIENKELDIILGDLEKRGLMKVVHKQGLFGPKVELHATRDSKNKLA